MAEINVIKASNSLRDFFHIKDRIATLNAVNCTENLSSIKIHEEQILADTLCNQAKYTEKL